MKAKGVVPFQDLGHYINNANTRQINMSRTNCVAVGVSVANPGTLATHFQLFFLVQTDESLILADQGQITYTSPTVIGRSF